MADNWVFESVVGFLRSPFWQVPIAEFMDRTCIIFDPEEENKLAYTEAHEARHATPPSPPPHPLPHPSHLTPHSSLHHSSLPYPHGLPKNLPGYHNFSGRTPVEYNQE